MDDLSSVHGKMHFFFLLEAQRTHPVQFVFEAVRNIEGV